MAKEQEEAIERCKELIKETHAGWIGISNQKAIKTILSMLEEKDKQIELMAETIMEDENVMCEFDFKKWESEEEIKQYFENKVKEK